MPLIGYVSDERYVTLPEVSLEFIGNGRSVEARSRASGSVHADLSPGDFRALEIGLAYSAAASGSNLRFAPRLDCAGRLDYDRG